MQGVVEEPTVTLPTKNDGPPIFAEIGSCLNHMFHVLLLWLFGAAMIPCYLVTRFRFHPPACLIVIYLVNALAVISVSGSRPSICITSTLIYQDQLSEIL